MLREVVGASVETLAPASDSAVVAHAGAYGFPAGACAVVPVSGVGGCRGGVGSAAFACVFVGVAGIVVLPICWGLGFGA